jgi:hypothetical protein
MSSTRAGIRPFALDRNPQESRNVLASCGRRLRRMGGRTAPIVGRFRVPSTELFDRRIGEPKRKVMAGPAEHVALSVAERLADTQPSDCGAGGIFVMDRDADAATRRRSSWNQAAAIRSRSARSREP